MAYNLRILGLWAFANKWTQLASIPHQNRHGPIANPTGNSVGRLMNTCMKHGCGPLPWSPRYILDRFENLQNGGGAGSLNAAKKSKLKNNIYIYIYIKWRRLQERREGVPTLFRLKLIVEKTNSPILCSARTEIEAMRASRYRIRCGFSWMAHIHTRRHLKAIWWNLQMRMSNSPIISSNKWKTHQRSQLLSGAHVLRAHDTYMDGCVHLWVPAGVSRSLKGQCS